MPTVRRKVIRRLVDDRAFTEERRHYLLTGHDFFGVSYGDPETPEVRKRIRNDWLRHRAELMAEHQLEPGFVPGTRPWAWWEFEAKEPRWLLKNSVNKPLTDKLYFGAPALMTHSDFDHPIVETELDYLERLGLLTEREQRYVAKWKQHPDGLTEAQARELWERGDITQLATVRRFTRRKRERKKKGSSGATPSTSP